MKYIIFIRKAEIETLDKLTDSAEAQLRRKLQVIQNNFSLGKVESLCSTMVNANPTASIIEEVFKIDSRRCDFLEPACRAYNDGGIQAACETIMDEGDVDTLIVITHKPNIEKLPGEICKTHEFKVPNLKNRTNNGTVIVLGLIEQKIVYTG